MIGEVNILGLYMSPLLPCILVAVFVSRLLRGYLMKRKVYSKVWHAPLFDICLTVICSGVLVFAVSVISRFNT